MSLEPHEIVQEKEKDSARPNLTLQLVQKQYIGLIMSKEVVSGYVAKPRQIKPWPNLTGLLPLLRSDEGVTKSATGKFHLDMSNVNKVDSIGLAIFVAQLCQLFSGKSHHLIITGPKSKNVSENLERLNFQQLLSTLGILSSHHQDLFSIGFNPFSEKNKTEKIKNDFNKIIYISHSEVEERADQISRIKNEIKEFFKHDDLNYFSHQQVMIILVELVKNTLDHSGKPALLAMKMGICDSESHFSFVYCDTGDGICHSVRKHMTEQSDGHQDPEEYQLFPASERFRRLAAKGSFADFLQWALQPGNSTKHGNGINLGLGLMLIVEASKNCNIRLTVKDADTSMVLTELSSVGQGVAAPYTHALIRQLGVKTCASPMLMFYGEIDFEGDSCE